MHPGTLPGLANGGKGGLAGAGHLLSAARCAGGQREHHRHLYRGSLSGTPSHLFLPQRRRRRDPAGQCRPDASQLFPVEDPDLRESLYEHILRVHLKDNSQARRLLADGSYERVHPQDGEPELNSQLWMIEHRGLWNDEE